MNGTSWNGTSTFCEKKSQHGPIFRQISSQASCTSTILVPGASPESAGGCAKSKWPVVDSDLWKMCIYIYICISKFLFIYSCFAHLFVTWECTEGSSSEPGETWWSKDRLRCSPFGCQSLLMCPGILKNTRQKPGSGDIHVFWQTKFRPML